MVKSIKNKEYLSIPEAAKILGISRIAVYRKVKSGIIKADKIGRNYAIPRKYIKDTIGSELGEEGKAEIDKAVHRTVKEYGEVLRRLGREEWK
jgi:excisionase family DNA binding protein